MANRICLLLASATLIAAVSPASAQLRVVTYNTLDKPVGAVEEAQLDVILSALAATPRNGIAKRPDVLALQEQTAPAANGSTIGTAQAIAARLNALFGVSSYEATLVGAGSDRVGLVHDASTITLLESAAVDTRGVRPALRVQLQPVGYTDPDSVLTLYNGHLRAGRSSTQQSQRAGETAAIRADAETLGQGVNVIYAGDLNLTRSTEAAYLNLTAPGAARANDPLALPAWPGPAVAEHLTQSTRAGNLSDGGATAGIDDRFDFQLVTDPLLDGEGLSYLGPTSTGLSDLEHSHVAFGNDGTTYDASLLSDLSDRSQPLAVLQALHDFSDHLPVVADYQVPAVLGVRVGRVPARLALDEPFALGIGVSNNADVVAQAGADELDYSATLSGGLGGSFSGTLAALSEEALHGLALDTSTPGIRSGVLRVVSNSQAAENALVEIPISYEVVTAALPGDYNADGVVDAADYTLWRDGLPLANEGATIGATTPEDYLVWRNRFGTSTRAVTIPEPGSASLAWLAGVCGWRALRKRARA